jgi:hypothetical protein
LIVLLTTLQKRLDDFEIDNEATEDDFDDNFVSFEIEASESVRFTFKLVVGDGLDTTVVVERFCGLLFGVSAMDEK